jgi:hypothetical protein
MAKTSTGLEPLKYMTLCFTIVFTTEARRHGKNTSVNTKDTKVTKEIQISRVLKSELMDRAKRFVRK